MAGVVRCCRVKKLHVSALVPERSNIRGRSWQSANSFKQLQRPVKTAINALMGAIEWSAVPIDCHWSSPVMVGVPVRTEAILLLADSAPAARALLRSAVLNMDMVDVLWKLCDGGRRFHSDQV
jgi:hypothetical protein